ncbi:sigma factor-like helix-turn-helix DNA-binding protein [Desulfotruncus arcticus]|uniref:sigma factor-like helix-turn-helix DNA-binding protein n=1 Tax=Desulfotruncus arcticus TaxID=341036 RepID=UPI001EE3DD92|nr:sigma factor-like helix-turn-helix DNA-binding protein [Desulfotruncus arcticus]
MERRLRGRTGDPGGTDVGIFTKEGNALGSVKIDLATKEKRLEDAYPLDKVKGVYALLLQMHRIREVRYLQGDFDACILLMDFYQSIKEAKLTERQQEVIYHVFIKDLTQYEVARILTISQQAVSDHVNNVVRKVAANNKAKEEAQDIV